MIALALIVIGSVATYVLLGFVVARAVGAESGGDEESRDWQEHSE